MLMVDLDGMDYLMNKKIQFSDKNSFDYRYCKTDISHGIDFMEAKISDVNLKPANFEKLGPRILRLCSKSKTLGSNSKIRE